MSASRKAWLRLYRHYLRLLRNSTIAWTLALAGIGAAVIATFEDRYTTEAELQALAQLEGIPAFEALVGPYSQIATVEGFTLSRWGMFAILVAVWGMRAAGRLLRSAEEAGHIEPLRAGAITPHGLLSAAVTAMLTVFAAFGIAIGLSHSALGMDTATSWALGAAMALMAAAFAALAALASQVFASSRQAIATVGTVLGITLGMRVIAAASGTPEWLWWVTPFGWTGFLHEADEAQLIVVAAFAAITTALLAGAFALAKRDLHGGVITAREGAADRVRPVKSAAGLAARITARAAVIWGAVITIVSIVFAMIAHDFADAATAMPTTVEVAAQAGWGRIDSLEGILGFTFALFIAPLLAVFAAGQAASIREEEASWRIEHLLVRPIGRTRWLLTRTAIAAAATVSVAIVAGLAAWAGTAVTGTPITLADALRGALNIVPVSLLFLGLGLALFGLVPRLTASLTLGLVVASYLLDFVGGYLDLPEAVLDASPFRHIASAPGADIELAAAVVMLAIGLAGIAVGAIAFRRRDLQEA